MDSEPKNSNDHRRIANTLLVKAQIQVDAAKLIVDSGAIQINPNNPEIASKLVASSKRNLDIATTISPIPNRN